MDDLEDMPEFCRKEGGDLDDLGDKSLSYVAKYTRKFLRRSIMSEHRWTA